jgi:hypothetical protein
MKQEIVCISTSTRHGIYHLGALWGMWWQWWKCAPLGCTSTATAAGQLRWEGEARSGRRKDAPGPTG